MKNKKLVTSVLSIIMTAGMISTAFAGRWEVDFNGWRYVHDDGTSPRNTWEWIDGDGDGFLECYYFDYNGNMVHNTNVGGFIVNENGHWTVGGDVQLEFAGQDSGNASAAASDSSTAAAYDSSTAAASGSTSAAVQAQNTVYAEVYRKYEAQYGATEMRSAQKYYAEEPEKTVFGINFLGLYDLNGDGIDEFLIGYTTPNPEEYAFCEYCFGLDVYTQNESGPVLCGQIKEAEMWTGGELDCGIRLVSKDGKIYIVSGSEGTGGGSVYHFYTLYDGNNLQEILSYELMEDIKVNGQKSNMSYESLWAGITQIAHFDIFGIEADWAEVNFSKTLDQISTVKAQLGV